MTALVRPLVQGRKAEKAVIPLRDIPLFRNLSIGELKALQTHLKDELFKKGDIILNEGDSCERIFIVRSGRVKVFKTSAAGKELILEVLEPGDTCACHHGDTCWSCSSSAQAMTSCQVSFLSRHQYIQLAKGNSKLVNQLNVLFAHRLSYLKKLIEQVTLDDPQRRLVKFILDMCQSHSMQCPGQNYLCISQEEIALRLGLVRETVTRHLHRLKNLKLIALGKSSQITILNQEGLEKLLL